MRDCERWSGWGTGVFSGHTSSPRNVLRAMVIMLGGLGAMLGTLSRQRRGGATVSVARLRRSRTGGASLHLAAAAVLATAVLVGCTAEPDASTAPSANGSESPTVSLVAPGSTIEIEARDVDGSWGTITLVRAEDVGGFRVVSNADLDPDATDASAMFFENDPEAFYLVLGVTYRADRIPEQYGASDWLVRTSPGGDATPIERGGVEQDLGVNLPGSNLRLGPSTATLIVPVPRAAAQEPMTLVYQPGGVVVAEVPVRAPGEPPPPVASVVPPRPVPEGYVTQPDLPISVLFSETADDLFSRPDTCTNPEAGFTVTYPDDWWTNTAIGDVPACSWFSPAFFEVADPVVVPEEVVIVITVFTTNAIGMSGQALPVPEIESIGNRSAARSEQVGVGGGFIPFGSHAYGYNVWIEGTCCNEAELSVIAVARTQWAIDDDPADYILHKAVLDRVMASISFEE